VDDRRNSHRSYLQAPRYAINLEYICCCFASEA
jgi:hypothetical protein